ncbi:hypothetical protein TNCV_1058721 [Trichonephila clavipes]|nr:hypothetical protein TNCV_1058721 [Trichonephila clavipes]
MSSNLVPLKIHSVEELKPVKYVEAQSPLVGGVWKLGEETASPGVILVTTEVLDESRSFFRVHTGYFSNIPKCIKAEFIASWACSQSSVVSSSQR